MVKLTASGDADQVEARLREALDAHGLQLFARIDHAAGARKADVELEADVLLIFGNVRVGIDDQPGDPRQTRETRDQARVLTGATCARQVQIAENAKPTLGRIQ